jgi:hypothetical protein
MYNFFLTAYNWAESITYNRKSKVRCLKLNLNFFFQVMEANCEETRLSFTAPGSSLDSEEPAAVYTLKIAATAANLSGVLFDSGVSEAVSEADLLNGSLSPVPGGQTVLISLSASRCPPNQLVYLAMRALNSANQSSAVSNIVAAMPTCSAAVSLPVMSPIHIVMLAAFFLGSTSIRL